MHKLPSHRLDRIDLLRAVAMLWMTAFHFCFDLNHLGFIQQNFYDDPFWTWQRTAIVSLFLFTAGLSQAVALQQGQGWPRFWKRWTRVAGGALLVSMGSWLMFPDTFIYFGILHGIAAMLILVRLTAGWGVWLWPLGALAISMKWVAPLVIGALPALAFLTMAMTCERLQRMLMNRPSWLGAGDPPSTGWKNGLVKLGRWSLSYYLLHQPVMIGLLAAFVWWRG